MNLQEFINYRTRCPICDHLLSLVFHSKRKQVVINDKESISFNLKILSLKGYSCKYSASFKFNKLDDEFCVDFFEQSNFLESVNLSTIKSFRKFQENMQSQSVKSDQNFYSYFLYNCCNNCNNYHYESKIIIDYNMAKFKISQINLERIWFRKLNYILHNYINENKSKVLFYDLKDKGLEVPLIKFTNMEDTAARIKKLLIFS